MAGFGGEIAIAVVVVAVILVLLCVFLGVVLYYGCAAVCCCHNETYDVCEQAAQARARKRGAAGASVEGTVEFVNPLDRMETSALYNLEAVMTPLAGERAGHAAPVMDGIPVSEVIPAAATPVPLQDGEGSVFEDGRPVSSTEAAVAVAATSTRTSAYHDPITATLDTPVTTCFNVSPVVAV